MHSNGILGRTFIQSLLFVTSGAWCPWTNLLVAIPCRFHRASLPVDNPHVSPFTYYWFGCVERLQLRLPRRFQTSSFHGPSYLVFLVYLRSCSRTSFRSSHTCLTDHPSSPRGSPGTRASVLPTREETPLVWGGVRLPWHGECGVGRGACAMPPRKKTKTTVAKPASDAEPTEGRSETKVEALGRKRRGKDGRERSSRDVQDVFLHTLRKELEQQAPPSGWTRHGIRETFGYALEGLPDGDEKRRLEQDTEKCVEELCHALGVEGKQDGQTTERQPPMPVFLEKGYLQACQALAPMDLKPVDEHEGLLFARIPPDERLIDKYVESRRPIGITELEQISRLATTFVNAHADRGVHALNRLVEECRRYLSKTCVEENSQPREQKLGRLEQLLIGLSTSLSTSRGGTAEANASEYWPTLANTFLPNQSSEVSVSSTAASILAQITVSLCELKLQCSDVNLEHICSKVACLAVECPDEITDILLEEKLPVVCGATREEKVWSLLYEALCKVPTTSDDARDRRVDSLHNHVKYLQSIRIARKASKHLLASGQSLRSAEILSTAASVAPPTGFLRRFAKYVGDTDLEEEGLGTFLVTKASDEELKHLCEQLGRFSGVVKYRPSAAVEDGHAEIGATDQATDTEDEDEVEEPTFFIDKNPIDVKPVEILPEGHSFPRSIVERLDAGEGSRPGDD